MTKEQEKQYVLDKGCICPYCQSKQLFKGYIESAEIYSWREVTCGECGQEWNEISEITGAVSTRV